MRLHFAGFFVGVYNFKPNMTLLKSPMKNVSNNSAFCATNDSVNWEPFFQGHKRGLFYVVKICSVTGEKNALIIANFPAKSWTFWGKIVSILSWQFLNHKLLKVLNETRARCCPLTLPCWETGNWKMFKKKEILWWRGFSPLEKKVLFSKFKWVAKKKMEKNPCCFLIKVA